MGVSPQTHSLPTHQPPPPPAKHFVPGGDLSSAQAELCHKNFGSLLLLLDSPSPLLYGSTYRSFHSQIAKMGTGSGS